MKPQHINEIKAIIVLAVGLLFLASFASFVPEDLPWYTSTPNTTAQNLIRITGAYIAGTLFFVFGYGSYALVFFLFFLSWAKFSSRELSFSFSKFLGLSILFCVLSSLFSLIGSEVSILRFQRSGIVGLVISDFLVQYFGRAGSFIILLTLVSLSLIVIGEFLLSPFLFGLVQFFKETLEVIQETIADQRKKMMARNAKAKVRNQARTQLFKKPNKMREKGQEKNEEEEEISARGIKSMPPEKPKIRIASSPKDGMAGIDKEKPKLVGEYQLPPLDLLNDPPQISAERMQDELVAGAKTLEETLSEFGVSVRVADIERGPVITRYELEPAPGVKVQKITTLADDIALAMKAATVRIVAPIPGKNRVGIEIPNGASSLVYLKDVISDNKFRNSGSKLMLALGKDISGKPLIADLAEMPHLLIAGTTGAGKTVCVNSLIMSMIFNASPDEVKFLMVDPKMVELTQYNDLPHALCPSVTDAKKVSAALNWIVGEMETRYSLLSKAGVRNIKAYHAKGHQLPYVVVIIDELADLMQVAAKTIESAITRLAQLSRAVGIHLILATQRPSVDVITGVIKANFPARVSFKVASKVDSRTVLDMNGAENLIGRGDMLFIKPGDAKPTRGQCSLVSDGEIQRVIDFISKQQNPDYDDSILQKQAHGMAGGFEQKDELYDEAVKLVLETNQASVSILQRRMRLGYTRAARLIDMMEQDGIVGPYCGSRPRDIIVDREEWLLKNMQQEE